MDKFECIKALSSAFDNLEYDRISFYSDKESRTLVPYLKEFEEIAPNEAQGLIENFFGIEQTIDNEIRAELIAKGHLSHTYRHRLTKATFNWWAWIDNYQMSETDNPYWKVITVSDLNYVPFYLPLDFKENISTRQVLDQVINSCNRGQSQILHQLSYSPRGLRDCGINHFCFRNLYDWLDLENGDELVFIALRHLIDKSSAFITGFMNKQMSKYVEYYLSHSPYLHGGHRYSSRKFSKEIFEYSWKSQVRINFELLKHLFVTDEQKDALSTIISFCRCDIIPQESSSPYYCLNWGRPSLERLWRYLIEDGQIASNTSFDLIRYYFGGGKGPMPKEKIIWIGQDSYKLYALIQVFDKGAQHDWKKANLIFDTQGKIEISGRRYSSISREPQKGIRQKMNPLKRECVIIRNLRKS